MSFGPHTPPPPTGKPILRVVQVRRDGKLKVSYCFSAKTFVKVITREQLDAEAAKGSYDIIGR